MLFWACCSFGFAVIYLPGDGRALASGMLMGISGFNLYDGAIQHKLLRLHPVREM